METVQGSTRLGGQPPNYAETTLAFMPEQDFRIDLTERLLIVALLNYRRAVTGRYEPGESLKALNDLTDIEANHYQALARRAVDFIWGGR